MLAFLDLETTGLDSESDDILEVACVVTEDDLQEVARYHSVLVAHRPFHRLPEVVRDMHAKSGLWDEATGGSKKAAKTLGAVDQDLSTFLRAHAVRIQKRDDGTPVIERAQLAGLGVYFDRMFMKRCLPRAEAELHYRQLDLTGVNELFARFRPSVYEGRPKHPVVHRAMPDVLEAIDVARYYGAWIGSPEHGANTGTP